MSIQLPAGMTDPNALYPAFFIPFNGADVADPTITAQLNNALHRALCDVHGSPIKGQALMKVHVGEPKCATRMKPSLVAVVSRFLYERGVDTIVAGDTTVAYTGPRGHRQNPENDSTAYLALAQDHGWSREGDAGMPFVVLDRPSTGTDAGYQFKNMPSSVEIDGIQRFSNFWPATGFASADFTINHAHLTLHGLAGVAGCIKSIAMGCSALPGKLRMHQSLLPYFAIDKCKSCGLCVRNCPEQSLNISKDDAPPEVDTEKCIGCGECVAVCKTDAVQLKGKEIEDWKLGGETLPGRMADYAMGIMNGRWDKTIHIMHLYSVTKLCDCLNEKQKPLVQDIGFLLGKNPFAIDKLAGELLSQALPSPLSEELADKLSTAAATADYVGKHYNIHCDVPLISVPMG